MACIGSIAEKFASEKVKAEFADDRLTAVAGHLNEKIGSGIDKTVASIDVLRTSIEATVLSRLFDNAREPALPLCP